MIRVLRKLAILAALGVAVVLGGAQQAKADHDCGSGGYYRGGYTASGHSYRSGTMYYARPSYQTHGHSYSHGQRHFSDYRRAPHFDVSVHTRRPSYSHDGHLRRHHD